MTDSAPGHSERMPLALFAFLGIMLAIFGWFGWTIYTMETKMEAERLVRRIMCTDLNARYGKTYQAVRGPYRNVPMLAVDFTDEAVGLITKYGNDDTKRWFKCADIIQVDDRT